VIASGLSPDRPWSRLSIAMTRYRARKCAICAPKSAMLPPLPWISRSGSPVPYIS
jgi:hypothetical protein